MFKNKKILIKTGYVCNSGCLFCWTKRFGNFYSTNLTTNQVIEKINLAKKTTNVDTIVLSGGEITIRKDLFTISKYIQNNNLKLAMGTNGRMFSNQKFLDELIKYGLDFVQISYYSNIPEIHKKITQTDTHTQSISGIKNIIKAKINLLINVVVHNLNINEISKIANYLHSIGVNHINFSFVEPAGKAKTNLDLIPNIFDVSKKIKTIIKNSPKELNIYFEGIPFCLMKPFENKYLDLTNRGIIYLTEAFENKIFNVDHNNCEKFDLCNDCIKKNECPGHYTEYLNIINKEEFKERTKNLIFKD